jgi:hypothetical protein
MIHAPMVPLVLFKELFRKMVAITISEVMSRRPLRVDLGHPSQFTERSLCADSRDRGINSEWMLLTESRPSYF